jgi:hypothetical protein
MAIDLDSAVALVTGGANGIGAATARRLAAAPGSWWPTSTSGARRWRPPSAAGSPAATCASRRVREAPSATQRNLRDTRSSGIAGERWMRVIPPQAFNGAHRFEDFQCGDRTRAQRLDESPELARRSRHP